MVLSLYSKGYVSTGVQPQTAVVTAECPGGGIVRTADVRVSMRTPLTHLRLKSFGPIYNLFSHNVRNICYREHS